jgi:F-type H+-transporting ATPase subunit epsilon
MSIMSKLFKLEILTPERQFFDGEAELLTITTTDGSFSFLANHEPNIMPVAVGAMEVRTPDKTIEAFSSEGFLEVRHEGILVYVQACERPDEIDDVRAVEAQKRAEERMRQKQSMKEYQQSKMAMARAMARLQITKKRTRF